MPKVSPSVQGGHFFLRLFKKSKVNIDYLNEACKEFYLVTLSNRRIKGDLITMYKYLHKKKKSNTNGIF